MVDLGRKSIPEIKSKKCCPKEPWSYVQNEAEIKQDLFRLTTKATVRADIQKVFRV